MVKGFSTIGLNVEAKPCISNVADYLKGIGAQFTGKPVQILESDSSMAFLGVPINTDQSIGKQLAYEVSKPPEHELIKEDPTNVPKFCHSRSNCVAYKIKKSHPIGMP